MKAINHILNFYLYSSLHIGFCCAMLYLFTINRYTINIDKPYLIFILASTIFTYSIHRIIGMNKVRKFENQGRFAVISKFRYHIITYTIISAIVSGYCFFSFDLNRILLLIGASCISIFYTLPIFGKSRRLRDFAFVKIFLIAVVWSYVTESIPLIENGYDIRFIALLFVERCIFFLAITIPFDIRDLEVDKTNNVVTLPSYFGAKKSIFLSILLLAICVGIEIIQSFVYNVNSSGVIAAIFAYAIAAVLIYFSENKKEDYYFSGLLDGTIMLPYLFLMSISL